jgi:predicted dehydrogenase
VGLDAAGPAVAPPLGLGVLGLGSVFWGPYRSLIERLTREGLVELVAVHDSDRSKQQAVGHQLGLPSDIAGAEELIAREDVDAVLVLTSMNEHGALALAALEAGKHVLVEKPLATSLAEARALLEASRSSAGVLVCAPHIVLAPTYREMHERVQRGVIGRLLLARARYGWSGPWWGEWFYRPGGGSLFDLGVYNLTSLCGFFGPVRRVTALVGTAIAERVVEDRLIQVEADDNAHVLLDFGESRFGSIMTGFTMQQYRSPALELYGSDGVLQMLGDDWAPEGFEQWRNSEHAWEVVPEIDPTWPWTAGLRHLVECVREGRPTVTRPEHALHALEVMLGAARSAETGRVVEIESGFPELDYSSLPVLDLDERRIHDPRTL